MSVVKRAEIAKVVTRMDADAPLVSIVVPTLREAAVLPALCEGVFSALRDAPYSAEMLIVDDDSRDGTDGVVAELARRHPIRLIVRVGERGLATAVLRGFEEARGRILAVMDADLSHPPAVLPELVEPIRTERADFVVGSRHVAGGVITNWPRRRQIISRLAALPARGLTAVRDPMSGFFCLRREVWAGCKGLAPLGYKIGLELLVRGGDLRVVEVPITFTDRRVGQSKMNLRTQWQYLRHLMRLYGFVLRRSLRRDR